MATSLASAVEELHRDSECAPGVYVTDGWRLFRIVSPFDPVSGRPAELEDCYTLETKTYGSHQLWAMQLRSVKHGEAAPS